ncbi:MAG: YdcH family protein [Beijerinckiaceae bacterium]
MSMVSNDDERITLERELQLLMQDHRDLDAAIVALDSMDAKDQLQLQRLKKRKLVLKDRIVQISGKLRPDIIA